MVRPRGEIPIRFPSGLDPDNAEKLRAIPKEALWDFLADAMGLLVPATVAIVTDEPSDLAWVR